MNTVLFVNATIGFSENLLLVIPCKRYERKFQFKIILVFHNIRSKIKKMT